MDAARGTTHPFWMQIPAGGRGLPLPPRVFSRRRLLPPVFPRGSRCLRRRPSRPDR